MVEIETPTGLKLTKPEDIEFFDRVSDIIDKLIEDGELERAYELIKERERVLREKLKETV
jgi:hypothetical protein